MEDAATLDTCSYRLQFRNRNEHGETREKQSLSCHEITLTFFLHSSSFTHKKMIAPFGIVEGSHTQDTTTKKL